MLVRPGTRRVIQQGAFCLLFASGALYAQDYPSAEDAFSTIGDRFRYYLHRTYTSRPRLAFLLADTGMGHALNDPEEWGRQPRSFGVRLASNFGRRVVANSIEFGLGAVLQEDARYRSSPEPGLRKRIRHATVTAFTARLPDGRIRPAYSRFGAIAGGVLISSRWHPGAASSSDLLLDVGFGVLDKIPSNLLDEFSPDMRRVGRKVFKTIWPVSKVR